MIEARTVDEAYSSAATHAPARSKASPLRSEAYRRTVDKRLEAAAVQADKHTTAGRERAARLLTQANALLRGAPVPSYATGATA